MDHRDYLALLRKVRQVPHVKKVFVRSGLRYDYIMYDKDGTFFKELVQHHVSGQLKVAPEHVSQRVLRLMGKPQHELYDRFVERYKAINRRLGKEQYIVPYFMSSHPGSRMEDAIELACYLKKTGQRPEQVQDFYPTPGTLSTTMFYTGKDPRTGEKVYIPKDPMEKRMQRAMLQFYRPENADLVRRALRKAHREDLIGFGPQCLVRPEKRPGGKRPLVQEGKRTAAQRTAKRQAAKPKPHRK